MDHASTVKTVVADFLSRLGLPEEVQIEVSYDEPNKLYLVSLQTNSPAVIIGYHGENLAAVQLILGQHLHAELGEWVNLSLNVNDYRQRRETALHSLADSAVSRVVSTGQPHALPPLPSNERRIIHLYLSDHPQVVTESQGEGRARTIVISPKPTA